MIDAPGPDSGSHGAAGNARPSKLQSSNLRQRIVSALVLVALALALTWLGGFWFRLLAVAVGGAILYEWLAITAPLSSRRHRAVVGGLCAVLLIALLVDAAASLLLGGLVAAFGLAWLHARTEDASAWPCAGILYAGASAIALALVRGADAAGLAAAVFLFAVVWATDIFAYFAGKAVGGPKLAPSISPGKTWSGAIGGALAGVIAGLVAGMVLGSTAGVATLAAWSILLSVVSQAGDLAESAFKRRFSVKDSGRIIPGHGGVMDRVDGLVAAAALLALAALASGRTPGDLLFVP